MLISVDPGITGAIAFHYDSGEVSVHDMPIRPRKTTGNGKNEIDPVALQDLIRSRLSPAEKALVVMENLNTFAAAGGARSIASLQASKDVVCAVMELNRLDVAFVTPHAWQTFFGIRRTPTSDTKTQSLELARKLFGMEFCPLKKHNGRADALLIGRYGQRTLT